MRSFCHGVLAALLLATGCGPPDDGEDAEASGETLEEALERSRNSPDVELMPPDAEEPEPEWAPVDPPSPPCMH